MMDADRLVEKLRAAGCVATSAGIIAVDTQRLIRSFIEALETIEQLEREKSEAEVRP
jgi:hypothetical protein